MCHMFSAFKEAKMGKVIIWWFISMGGRKGRPPRDSGVHTAHIFSLASWTLYFCYPLLCPHHHHHILYLSLWDSAMDMNRRCSYCFDLKFKCSNWLRSFFANTTRSRSKHYGLGREGLMFKLFHILFVQTPPDQEVSITV